MIYLNKKYVYAAGGLLLGIVFGLLLFFLKRDMLIIRWTGSIEKDHLARLKKVASVQRKKIKYYFFKDDAFHHEDGEMIWRSSDLSKSVTQLVGDWLTILQGQQLISNTVFLKSVAFSFGNEEVFLHFNKTFLSDDASIMKKWHIIECLFKTLRGAGLRVQGVRFFVEDKLLEDDHLDFSQPWSITGFL